MLCVSLSLCRLYLTYKELRPIDMKRFYFSFSNSYTLPIRNWDQFLIDCVSQWWNKIESYTLPIRNWDITSIYFSSISKFSIGLYLTYKELRLIPILQSTKAANLGVYGPLYLTYKELRQWLFSIRRYYFRDYAIWHVVIPYL